MESALVVSALALAWFSFLIFVVITWRQQTAAKAAATEVKTSTEAAKSLASATNSKSLVDFDPSKLFESAAKLVDSLTKAGPGLASLGAAVLFLAIAAYAVQKPDKQSAADAAAKPETSQKANEPSQKSTQTNKQKAR